MYTLIARSVDHDVSPDHHGYAGLGEDDLHAVEAVEKFLQGGFLGRCWGSGGNGWALSADSAGTKS